MFSSSDIYRALTSGHLDILPAPRAEDIQPASVDLHLAADMFTASHLDPVDPFQHSTYPEWKPAVSWTSDAGYVLSPGRMVLASTMERIIMPKDLVGVVEGKSSLARLGLLVHQTAGFIDPGFEGQITLELSVASSWPVVLHPGMPICQISFARTDTPSATGYEGKYQGQAGPSPSLYHQNEAPASF